MQIKTIQEVVEDMLLTGKHINKFDLLTVSNSVCLAQRILDIKQQKGWNILSKTIKGKGTLREYWLDDDEIARIQGKPLIVEQQPLGLFGEL